MLNWVSLDFLVRDNPCHDISRILIDIISLVQGCDALLHNTYFTLPFYSLNFLVKGSSTCSKVNVGGGNDKGWFMTKPVMWVTILMCTEVGSTSYGMDVASFAQKVSLGANTAGVNAWPTEWSLSSIHKLFPCCQHDWDKVTLGVGRFSFKDHGMLGYWPQLRIHTRQLMFIKHSFLPKIHQYCLYTTEIINLKTNLHVKVVMHIPLEYLRMIR